MPPRSVKMNRFIFGFQRRVWWPKWTPASRRSFMETTGMRPLSGWLTYGRRRLGGDRTGAATATSAPRRVGGTGRTGGIVAGCAFSQPRRAGRGTPRDPRRVVAVAADRRLDPAGARARAAVDEREVGALEAAAAREVGERLPGG